jgi:protein-S-isoprenylcysteine O-methyltransferase Ste14
MSYSPRLIIGIIVGLPSFVLINISRRQLGKSFSIMPKSKTLVTTGLYSKIQHPMYIFLDLFLFAIIIIINLPALLLIFGILMALQVLQSQREEKLLYSAFGKDYETYIKQTWF